MQKNNIIKNNYNKTIIIVVISLIIDEYIKLFIQLHYLNKDVKLSKIFKLFQKLNFINNLNLYIILENF